MTVLYRNIQNESDSKLLQKDMSNIFRWESDWQMEFHPSKCQLLRVTKKPRPSPTIYDIHEHKLEIVESDQCLRVTIHTTINWNTHIESITKKATRPGSLFKETCNTVHKEQRMYATQRY